MDEKKIEEKIEQISRKVEEKAREIGNIVDEKIKAHLGDKERRESERVRHKRNREFWGVVLLIFGLLFLAHNMFWIGWDFPIWALGMIVVGLYLIFRKRND